MDNYAESVARSAAPIPPKAPSSGMLCRCWACNEQFPSSGALDRHQFGAGAARCRLSSIVQLGGAPLTQNPGGRVLWKVALEAIFPKEASDPRKSDRPLLPRQPDQADIERCLAWHEIPTSKERVLIAQILICRNETSLSVEEIFAATEQNDMGACRPTIYRTLKVFAEAGLVLPAGKHHAPYRPRSRHASAGIEKEGRVDRKGADRTD